MARESLGLFDRRPSRGEKRTAYVIVGLALLALLAILPFRHMPVATVGAFVPVLNAIMFVGELIIGTLLYGQAALFRSRALVLLASVYMFGTLLLIPHALTFPGALSAGGLLGAGLSSTGYIATFWRFAFPLGVVGYALLVPHDLRSPVEPSRMRILTRLGFLGAVTMAALATLAATVGHDYLPPLFVDRGRVSPNLLILTVSLVVFVAGAMAFLRYRFRSVLDMWLMTALACSLIQGVLNVGLPARFTLGWYGLWLLLMLSNLIVMLALLIESNRLYARLALSNAASRREREARLLSMDAVTAAVSHEVGQPLTAVSLNATAALNWLEGKKPDVDKATAALRAISDAARRSFDIIKSIRATFAKEPGRSTEFSLNELVLETASLFDRELAADKVSLELALDDSLPPVIADRVQLQRVFVNLMMNAIESLRRTPARGRSIAIRSAPVGANDVVVQVSDTGRGIADEDMEHIFDAFFTTKATGTGLGLALCRTIVEEHGGRLWASAADPHGAIFYLQLPRSGSVAASLGGAGQVLEDLEASLQWMRQSSGEDATGLMAELQHVIDEVRDSIHKGKR